MMEVLPPKNYWTSPTPIIPEITKRLRNMTNDLVGEQR